MISAATLAALIHTCSPAVDVRTESAIVAVESEADSWAVHDPIRDRAIHPASFAQAVKVANALIAEDARGAHRGVAVGLAQILLPRPGLSAEAMLHPCNNLRASQQILAEAYAEQYSTASAPTESERQQIALRRAFSVYNSGSPTAAPDYVNLVLGALSSPLVVQTTSIADSPHTAHTHRRPAAPVVPALPAMSPAPQPPVSHISSVFYTEAAAKP